MRCQFGIFDVSTDGKLNCFEAGASNIKLLGKEEVEDMTFCDKMVQWTKMELNDNGAKEDSELKLADKLLRNR
jgi:endo-1,4-beta-mannosidase